MAWRKQAALLSAGQLHEATCFELGGQPDGVVESEHELTLLDGRVEPELAHVPKPHPHWPLSPPPASCGGAAQQSVVLGQLATACGPAGQPHVHCPLPLMEQPKAAQRHVLSESVNWQHVGASEPAAFETWLSSQLTPGVLP
jgi:hypothetical protein